MGAPMPGALWALSAFRDAGHTIHVYTIWEPRNHHAIIAWMDYYGIPFDMVTNRKQAADVYLDDKAVRFVDWGQVERDMPGLWNGGRDV